MLKLLTDCSTFAYADDTAIVVSDKNIDTACESMQKQLNKVSKWCHDNGLVINASKTKIMHIKPRHLTNTVVNIIFHDYQCLHNNTDTDSTDTCTVTIEFVKTYKYLGVYVDENFKWLTHIQYLSKKLRKAAYSLYHLGNCSTYDVLKQAYFSLAESYIRHGITAWGNSTYCKSLQQTQNQILKILLKNKQHNQQQFQIPLIYENSENFLNNSINVDLYINNNTNNVNINSTNTNDINNLNSYTDNNSNRNTVDTNQHNVNTYNTDHSIFYNSQANNNFENINNRIYSTGNIASKLQILNIKSIYYVTLINEFYNDPRFLHPIDHSYGTRQRTEGRFKVEPHRNNYGKNSLSVTLPNIFNKLPTHLYSIYSSQRRKTLLKAHLIETQ